MIQFEITEGPDFNVHAPFKFFQNQIYLGKNSGDLWIEDPELLNIHIMLEVVGKDLLIHPQKGVPFYLLNGKRATTIRKLKSLDQIQIGKTHLKILAYEETVLESKKFVLDAKLSQLIKENSSRLAVVELLTKKMK